MCQHQKSERILFYSSLIVTIFLLLFVLFNKINSIQLITINLFIFQNTKLGIDFKQL
jgi:hypothetical protein